MSTPAQINTLRATDFGDGLGTKDAVDKLFQILNPFLQAVQTMSTHGTSLADNVDVQIATFSFTAATTFSPLIIRLKDGKKPRLVLCSALNTGSQKTESTWNPAWHALGQSQSGNQIQIDDLVGLTAGSKYRVDVYVFF